MLTTIEPCWEFKSCTGYLVGDFKGSYSSPMKVYVSSLMAKIKRSKQPKKTKVTIKSPTELYINEPSTMPNTATKLTELNYIEVSVKDDIIKKNKNILGGAMYLLSVFESKNINYIKYKLRISFGRHDSYGVWNEYKHIIIDLTPNDYMNLLNAGVSMDKPIVEY